MAEEFPYLKEPESLIFARQKLEGMEPGSTRLEDYEDARIVLIKEIQHEMNRLGKRRIGIEQDGIPPGAHAEWNAINERLIELGKEFTTLIPLEDAENRQRKRIYNLTEYSVGPNPLGLVDPHTGRPYFERRRMGDSVDCATETMSEIARLVSGDASFGDGMPPEVHEKLQSDLLAEAMELSGMEFAPAAKLKEHFEKVVGLIKKLGVAAGGDERIENVLRVIGSMGLAENARAAIQEVRSVRESRLAQPDAGARINA